MGGHRCVSRSPVTTAVWHRRAQKQPQHTVLHPGEWRSKHYGPKSIRHVSPNLPHRRHRPESCQIVTDLLRGKLV